MFLWVCGITAVHVWSLKTAVMRLCEGCHSPCRSRHNQCTVLRQRRPGRHCHLGVCSVAVMALTLGCIRAHPGGPVVVASTVCCSLQVILARQLQWHVPHLANRLRCGACQRLKGTGRAMLVFSSGAALASHVYVLYSCALPPSHGVKMAAKSQPVCHSRCTLAETCLCALPELSFVLLARSPAIICEPLHNQGSQGSPNHNMMLLTRFTSRGVVAAKASPHTYPTVCRVADALYLKPSEMVCSCGSVASQLFMCGPSRLPS